MDRPWFKEDNKVDFVSDGLRCAMRRGPSGGWCGYVGIPLTHPWHGKDYRDRIKPTKDMLGPRDPLDFGPIDLLCMVWSGVDPENELDICLALRVHGGITYARNHEPFGEPDGLWWFGFDCAHSGDLLPTMAERYSHEGDVYRTQSYVVAECQSLAAQLAKIGAQINDRL